MGISLAQERTGKLTVFSDVPEVDIFVDGVWAAKNKLVIDIPVGKHYVRVAKGEETIQSGIVEIEEGKEKIVVAQPKGKAELPIRRMLYIFGSYSSLSYDLPASVTVTDPNTGASTTYGFKNTSYDPFFGAGAEMVFYLPFIDLSTNFGFNFNFTSNARGTIYQVGTTLEALDAAVVGVSTIYGNISKIAIYEKSFEINAGLGVNYSFYSGATYVGSPGGQVYLEDMIKEFAGKVLPQPFIIRLGYLYCSGTSSSRGYTQTVVNKGLFLRAGIAYNL